MGRHENGHARRQNPSDPQQSYCVAQSHVRRVQQFAKFHTELHKLHKTGASRRYLAGVPLPTLMLEFGHEPVAVTQDYLADVRKPGEAKKAVVDADFIPKPKVVKTGRDGD